MNNDLISRSALIQHAYSAVVDGVEKDIIDLSDVDNAPAIEPFERIGSVCDENCGYHRPQGEFSRKDLESWLYQIAMNNIGTDFEKSVVEIIHRLDGFERFVSEQKGGVENE